MRLRSLWKVVCGGVQWEEVIIGSSSWLADLARLIKDSIGIEGVEWIQHIGLMGNIIKFIVIS